MGDSRSFVRFRTHDPGIERPVGERLREENDRDTSSEVQVARRKSAAEKNAQSFYVQLTQGDVKDSDGQVKHRSDLDELSGMSTTSMDFDVASVEGEDQLQAYM